MKSKKLEIYVFAHWKPMEEPQLVGTLSALYAKGKKAFSFEYNKEWIKSKNQLTTIVNEVLHAVRDWEEVAKQIGIPNTEVELMKKAFNI